MKKTLLFSALILIFVNVFSQNCTPDNHYRFNSTSANSCMLNVNHNNIPNYILKQQRSTFKLWDTAPYTGVLINQNRNQNNIEQYFITGWHCVKDVNLSSVDLYFNYQSKSGNTNDVPENNRGYNNAQSTNTFQCGNEYHLRSRIEVVEHYWSTDFALCKIIEPIPPHFNVYYAGFNTRLLTQIDGPFVGIHHPDGDIKKASVAGSLLLNTTPVQTGCTIITTIIDNIFNWLGITINTQVICNYTSVPFYSLSYWVIGATQPGSSGSGIFTNNGRYIGSLEGGLSGCAFPYGDSYGKFRDAYNNAAVRSKLNPNDDWWVNTSGLQGQEHTCYPNLYDLNGQYFPAGDYQSENKITLNAETDIVTSTDKELRIYPNADYEFIAGNSITLKPGFHAEAGSHFLAKTGESCNPNTVGNKSLEIPFPTETFEEMDFDINKYIENNEFLINDKFSAKLFPNPTNGIVSIEIYNENENGFSIELYDVSGRVIYKDEKSSNNESFDWSFLENGIYLVKIKQGNLTQVKSIIKNNL
jgi:hypothetical protein